MDDLALVVKKGPTPYGTPDLTDRPPRATESSAAVQIIAAVGILIVGLTIFLNAGMSGAFADTHTPHGAALNATWTYLEVSAAHWYGVVLANWGRSVWLWAGWGIISVFLFVTLRWMTRLGR